LSSATPPLLEVKNLSAGFSTPGGWVTAVDNVSLDVRRNEILGVVGESGSGKSTAARCIIRLLQPPGRILGGQVLLEGRDVTQLGNRELRQIRGEVIGFVPQSPFGALNPVFRIDEQFANIIRAHADLSRTQVHQRALDLLASTGIADPPRVLRGYAHELSGGMAQRVVIALALSLNPKLLIADEPTTALDLTVQRQVLDLMRDLVRGAGRSMLLVTHDLAVVASYCDRVVVMRGGRIIEQGRVASVFNRPEHAYTRALLESASYTGPGEAVAEGPAEVVSAPAQADDAQRSLADARC
jgi:ABC-type dipeptide/oligopeptide/nickel transport system ATPase component